MNTRSRERSIDQGRFARTAILDAVSILTKVRSLETITIRDVLRRSGVSPGSLYRFYASKEDLLIAWELRELERQRDLVMRVCADLAIAGASVMAAAEACANAMFDAMSSHLLVYNEPLRLVTSLRDRLPLAEQIATAIVLLLDVLPNQRVLCHPRDGMIQEVRLAVLGSWSRAQIARSSGTSEAEQHGVRKRAAAMVFNHLFVDGKLEREPGD